jgi:uncharacterized protein YjbI with pentapeptide repeats
MNRPSQSAVAPRVLCPDTGDVVRLDQYVELWLEERRVGALEIVGDPGSGKSCAIAQLAELVPSEVLLIDDAPRKAVATAKALQAVIYTTTCGYQGVADVSVSLADWGNDELVEYLLATHADRCASIMSRIARFERRDRLLGNPALWTAVLDQMAEDESASDLTAMLRCCLSRRLPVAETRAVAEVWALVSLLTKILDHADLPAAPKLDWRTIRSLQHPILLQMLAIDRLRRLIESPDLIALPMLPRDLVHEAGIAFREDPQTTVRLRALIRNPDYLEAAMAASLLFAAEPAWRPEEPIPPLAGGFFPNADWPAMRLAKANLRGTDLSTADLQGVDLREADLRTASFAAAKLINADVRGCHAAQANFAHAEAMGLDASGGNFLSACFAGANLSRCTFIGATLQFADLRGASLQSADMTLVDFRGAKIEGADFSGANLSRTLLEELPLRLAHCDAVDFSRAILDRCDLEYMRLPNAQFAGAYLSGAWLTGSYMPKANLRGARLRLAGLADIDWEEADLRDADLRAATFFLGSTRSGLVDSPIACEGSRTGFYTDDFDEQQFKAPEEIRKANLRGADLRGAKIDDVDFYLVDLRDAIYDPSQAEHFRKCKAILVDRAVL